METIGKINQQVFGGGEKNAQSTSQSGMVDTTPDELKKLRDPFVNAITQIFAQGGRPAYTGPLVAGITPAETSQLGVVDQTANNPNRTGLINQTLQGQFLPGQPGSNPHLQAAIEAAQRPTLQGLEEVLGRTLPGRFALAGHMTNANSPTVGGGSSAFDRASAIATRGAADAMGDIATKMSFQGYESERGRQQQAIQLSQNDVDVMIKDLQAQGLPRLIEDMGIERGLAEFQSRTASLIEALKIAAGSPIAQQGQQSTSQSTSKENTYKGIIPGMFPGGMGGGSSGGGGGT